MRTELFGHTRNPNYLGEILIYLSFAILSWHWVPFAVLATWIFGFFVRNMLKKDKSLSRYPEFAEYKLRSGLLFPKLYDPDRFAALMGLFHGTKREDR